MTRQSKQANGAAEPNAGNADKANEGNAPFDLSDDKILILARSATNGVKFSALYDNGDLSPYNGDESRADMGLMNMLAFWTRCNAAKMERLFSNSQLGQREKWQRTDYRNMTIERAIADCREVYEPIRRPSAQEDFTLKPDDYSDVGQAEVFAREYGENLRYSLATDFISYNGTYWEECKPKAQGLAQELTGRQLQEARAAVAKANKCLEELGAGDLTDKTKKEREKAVMGKPAIHSALMKWLAAVAYEGFVIKARESKQIAAALQEIRPMVLIDVTELDAEPYLLNTPAGTYDLRRGMAGLRPHSARDFITKITAVSPSNKGVELWQDLLSAVFVGDRDLIEYVQLVAGVCAVGKVFIEQLVICHGDGRNGKSTFWNPIFKVFGSYSGSISADALTANCRHNVRPELAEVRGKRAILARELQEGKRLDESILKKITSTDPIDAEKKYKSPFQFVPTHTPIMYTNFLPKIGSRDTGTKRRLCVVPFAAKFEGKNDKKNYGDYLFDNAGGAILQWIIEGAQKAIDLDFQIEPPECVKQATEDYIEAFDWLSKFLEARCHVGEDESEKSGDLYAAYRCHCDDISESYKRSAQDFNAALVGAGFERVQPGGNKKPAYFQGLRLLTDAERDFDDDFLGTKPDTGAKA
jgi:P4 family phage/plasmid primase-like protien